MAMDQTFGPPHLFIKFLLLRLHFASCIGGFVQIEECDSKTKPHNEDIGV